MSKHLLSSLLLAVGLSLSTVADAQNNSSWWRYYFGGSQECHQHNGNVVRHYYWSRFFWWHNHCPNQKPVAEAGENQEVTSNDVVTLDASASQDPDGAIIRYRWRQLSGPRVRLQLRRSVNPRFIAPEVDEPTELVFLLKVRDNRWAKARDRVVITVNPTAPSLPPVADAGANQTVDEQTVVTLNGSASQGADSAIATYLWEQVSGSPVTLTDADAAMASFTAPSIDASETLEFRLTVTDAEGDSASATTLVTVEPVTPVSAVNVRARTIDASLVSGVNLAFYVDGVIRDDLTALVNESDVLTVDADTNYSIRATADGFATQVIPFRSAIADGNVDLDITLIPRGDEITISGAGSFSEEGADGAAVSFTSADFVDAQGNPVVGDITLTITPVDISQPATLAAFPGEFTGILEGSGDSTPIISLGTVEFEFTANGEPINLADGATADVLIPIYNPTFQDGTPIQVGDTTPLWSLNEETGIWQQEGTGTVVASIDSPTGLALSATVSHFSWWNCDVTMNAATVEVTVLGTDNGTATIFGSTTANIGFRPSLVDTTIPVNGTTNPLFIPSSAETCLWAEVNFNGGSSVTTPQQCVTPGPNEDLTLTFGTGSSEPLDILAVPGDATDSINITDFLSTPIDTIVLSPVSVETSVTYSLASGSLPDGIVLSTINGTQAEIAGIFNEAGSFSAVILATDSDGDTDSITINLDVSSDIPPPELINERQFLPPTGIIAIDLNDFNTGGAATMWSLEEITPPWLSLNGSTGLLTIDTNQLGGPQEFFGVFFSQITASNSTGSDTTDILIEAFGSEGISFSIGEAFEGQF